VNRSPGDLKGIEHDNARGTDDRQEFCEEAEIARTLFEVPPINGPEKPVWIAFQMLLTHFDVNSSKPFNLFWGEANKVLATLDVDPFAIHRCPPSIGKLGGFPG
jgi:hypothetical protein